MHLFQLSLVNFKNYENAELSFSADVNCLVGNNGSGKTNVLDAIYYLSYCKGYFNPIDSQNIKHEEPFFMIQGDFSKGEHIDKIHCAVKRGQKKKFSRNKKDYERLADHFGLYPAVMIAPNDTDLIREGSDVRRKFMDRVISQYSRPYLEDLIQYNKVLSQRNNLLKYFGENRTFDADNLDVWDEQLIALGTKLFETRSKFVEDFVAGFNEFYSQISGGTEQVSLAYKSDFQSGDFSELLLASRKKDLQFRRCTVGAHKDDLVFLIDEHPIKKFGSQGQQKSFLIALKLAQFQFIAKATGTRPILLLDDIFDKIDDQRVAALMKLVSEQHFGQLFITDTDKGRVPALFAGLDCDFKVFHVDQAVVEPLSENHGEKV